MLMFDFWNLLQNILFLLGMLVAAVLGIMIAPATLLAQRFGADELIAT